MNSNELRSVARDSQKLERNSPDFVHKLKVALKELRETEIWLKVIAKAEMVKSAALIVPLLQETDELIAILFTSVETSKKSKEQ